MWSIPATLKGQIIDLSLPVFDGAPTYSGLPECSVVVTHKVESDLMMVSRLTMNTHGTTHVDAPAHFIEDGRTIDKLDLSKCVGPATIIDLSYKEQMEAVEPVELSACDDIVVPGARVLLRFDWDAAYPQERYFTVHPFLSLDCVEWLASRGLALLGMDLPTPNQEHWLEAHRILLEREVVIVEALANLRRLPPGGFFFAAAPLRIKGGDGAPCRALAII